MNPVVIQGRTSRLIAERDGVMPSIARAIRVSGYIPTVHPPMVTIASDDGERAHVYWTVVFEATP